MVLASQMDTNIYIYVEALVSVLAVSLKLRGGSVVVPYYTRYRPTDVST